MRRPALTRLSLLRRFLASGCALLAAASVTAEERAPRWESAVLSGTPRLAFYSLAQERPAGSQRRLAAFLEQDGLLHPPGAGPRQVADYVSVRPMLSYDHNLNNGLPGDTLRLGRYEFRVREEDRAKAGLLAGAAVTRGLGYSIADGRVLWFSATAAYQHALEHDVHRIDAAAELCLRAHEASWTWLDLCTGADYLEKHAAQTETFLSGSMSRLFSSPWADHELRVGLKHSRREDYGKASVTLGLASAVPRLGAVSTSLVLGEEVPHHHSTRWGISAGLKKLVAGRATTFSASYLVEDGATVFGLPREEETTRLHLRTELAAGMSVGLGYEFTNSTVELFDDELVVLDIGFRGWRF